MKTNYLIQDMIKTSSSEMKKLFEKEFGLYSEAQRGSRPRRGGEKENYGDAEESYIPEEEGFTVAQWNSYIQALIKSSEAALNKASKSQQPVKIKNAREYSQKARAIQAEYKRMINGLAAKLRRGKRKFDPNTTIVPSYLFYDSSSGAGAAQRGVRGERGSRGGRGGSGEGYDLNASSQDRNYEIVPFGPFMNLAKIYNAGLLDGDLYESTRDVFGDAINIRNFRSVRDVLSEMEPADKELNAGMYLNNLLKAIVDIEKNWEINLRDNENFELPESYQKQQDQELGRWKKSIENLIRQVARQEKALRQQYRDTQRATKGYGEDIERDFFAKR